MKKALLLALLSLALILPASQSLAATITFTFTSTASGSINGNAFAASAFTLTTTADTANRIGPASGTYKYLNLTATIDILGVGSYTFVTPTNTFFATGNNTPGIQRTADNTDLVDGPFNSAGLSGWQMNTTIGPVSGNMMITQWTLAPVVTSGGTLVLNSATPSGTFRATVGSPASVPDGGSTLALLGLTLGGVALARRKLAAA